MTPQRNKSHERVRADDLGADACVGEDLKQQRVTLAAVDHVDLVDTGIQGGNTAGDLGEHTSGKNAVLKRRILGLCINDGDFSLADLSKELGTSIPTTTKLVEELLEDGLLEDRGKQGTNGGRRPSIYGLNPSAGYFVGVDIRRKFISYAVWWIRQSILQALAEQSRIVRLPLNQVGSLNKINKAFARFEQEHERVPSPEELAQELELPREKVTDTLRVAGRHISVDAPFADGEDNSLLDVLVNPDSPNADRGLINESLATEVDRALEILTEREQDIIRYFFGIGCSEMTLEEIGEKFDLTRERVRQIKEKAIRKLRQSARSSVLKSYLG